MSSVIIASVALFASTQGPSLTQWGLEQTVRIGALDGASALTRVGSVVSGRGLLFVTQPSEGHVKVFDARSGEPRGAIGRKGGGPGEFRSLNRLAVRADTLIVGDMFDQRINAFSLDGEVLYSRKVMSQPHPRSGRHLYAVLPAGDGTFWAERPIRVAAVARGTDTEHFVGIVSDHGGLLRTAFAKDLSGTAKIIVSGGGVLIFMQPYARYRLLYDYLPDARGVITVTPLTESRGHDVVQIDRISPIGDVVWRRRLSRPRVRLPRAMRDSILEAHATSSGIKPHGLALRQARKHVEVPEYLPPFAGVVAGTDGSVWLQGFAAPSGTAEILILNSDGELSAETTMPGHVRLLHVGAGRVWGITHDEVGVPYLLGFDIRKQ